MPNFKTLENISTELKEKKISSLELCREILADINLFNPSIGAYSDVLAETAETEARASDERRRQGASKSILDGIPIAVKDLIDTTPAICKAGLKHLSNYRPQHDAAVVRMLRDMGVVIVGVTETDAGAFGTSTPQVINPMAPNRIVGGSSGGSAAAVAAGLAFAAIGTDTGGSIRIPAACCSVFGFKPTRGRVNSTGVRPLAKSFDHVGPITRSVSDLHIIQAVLDPTIIHDVNTEMSNGLAIGMANSYYHDADQEVQDAMVNVFECLKTEGVNIYDVSLPLPKDVIPIHIVNAPKEAAEYHSKKYSYLWQGYPQVARTTIELGLGYSDEEYQNAEQQRAVIADLVDRAFENVDAIIIPTLPIDAPARDAESVFVNGLETSVLMATISYTALFNQTGHPVVSMPASIMNNGRAVSIQIVGPRNSDGRLLMIAQELEQLLSSRVDYASIMRKKIIITDT